MLRSRVALACIAILLVTGCSKSATTLIERQAAVLEEATEILKEIADRRPSEDEARDSTELQGKFERLGELQGEIDKLVRATAAQVDEGTRQDLEKAHRDRMINAANEFHTQLARVRELNLRAGGLSDLEPVLFKKSS